MGNLLDNKVFLLKEVSFMCQSMVRLDPIDRLLRASMLSDEDFVAALNGILKTDLRMTVRELSERSGIAASSLYKILHGERSPNLSTLRAIVGALRNVSNPG